MTETAVEETEFGTLRLERHGPVATVTLRRPEALNALNAAMFNDLERVFAQVEADAAVRVVLVTGDGERAFAAGADIRELIGTDAVSGRAVSERGKQVFAQVECLAKPVIACINGLALGGGCELAMACTCRFASEKAVLGLPEVKLGLIPGYGGTQRLRRLVGRSAALRMMLGAENVNAAEALRLGLVDVVVPATDLMREAQAFAARIAAVAPLAVTGVLEAVRRGKASTDDEAFDAETDIFSRLCGTADKHEGLTAFVEKRRAVWTGK